MATTIKILNADVSVDRDYVYELSKQYDNQSRKYRVLITDRGVPVSLTGDEGILLRMQAEGESEPYVLHWIDVWENGYPVVTMSNYMLSKVGVVHFEFVIFDAPGGSAVLSTRQQNMKIQKSLLNYDGLVASEDFDILSDLINQARTIPDLIDDYNSNKEQIVELLMQVQASMADYQSKFEIMQSNVDDMIQSANDYIGELTSNVANTLAQANAALSTANQLIETANDTVEQSTQKADEASASALLAKSAEDNSEQYYNQTKNLKEQVDASAELVIPHFYIDFKTGKLMSDTKAKGKRFWIVNGVLCGENIYGNIIRYSPNPDGSPMTETKQPDSRYVGVGYMPREIVEHENLYTGTKDFSGDDWLNKAQWTYTTNGYGDFTVASKDPGYNGLRKLIEAKAGEVYTFSATVRMTYTNSQTQSSQFFATLAANANKVSPLSGYLTTPNGEWTRVNFTTVVLEDVPLWLRIEPRGINDSVDQLEVCAIKVERGTEATPWTPAPSDWLADPTNYTWTILNE